MCRSLIHMLFLLAILIYGISAPSLAQSIISSNKENPENLKKTAFLFVLGNKEDKKDFDRNFKSFFYKQCSCDSVEYLFSLGHAYYLNKDYVNAIKYSLLARNPSFLSDKKAIEAEVNIQIGGSYYRLSYFEKALYFYKQALQFDNEVLPPKRRSRTLLDIGNVYFADDKSDSALLYYELAKENASNFDDSINIISSLINIGNTYIASKDYNMAEKTTLQALELSKLHKSEFTIVCYFNLAELYYYKRQYLESRENFAKVLDKVKGSQFERLIPEVYRFKALMDYETGDYEFAIQNCRLFQANKDMFFANKDFLTSLSATSSILLKLHDRPHALELLQKNIKLSDSIFNVELESKNNLEEFFQQLLQFEKNYKILEQRFIINKEKLKFSQLVIISIVLIMGMISLILLISIKAKNRIRKRNEIIKSQLKDITDKNEETNELNRKILIQAEEINIKNEHLTQYQYQLEKLIEERTNELSIALVHAHESDNLKSSFLQNISHEIRTPLNAISGFSQLLLFEGINNKEYLEIINQNVIDLIDMVENIMIFSQIHSNQMVPNIAELKIDSLIKELKIELLCIKVKFDNPNIKFNINNHINNGLIINSDISILKKIFVQVIENSYKFTEKGQITLDMDYKDDTFSFSISDTGMGIKEEQLSNIFDAFRKVEGEHKLFRGTGIGLSIVKKLTEMLNGEIVVDSEFGKGTTVSIRFPQCTASI